MQFVMLIYQGSTPLPGTPEWERLSPDEQKRIYAEYGELHKQEGLTHGLPLGLPENAMTVRVEGGEVVTSDGPYVDEKGAVGGYFILEADTAEEAVAVAAKVPAARLGGAIEVRPVATYW